MTRPLTKGQVEQAMGRSALVAELQEVERRCALGAAGLGELRKALGGDDLPSMTEANAHHDELERQMVELLARREEILGLLWHPDPEDGAREAPPWVDRIRATGKTEAIEAVDQVLRRRPEVTPPENVDGWTLPRIQDWLLEKIGELPAEDREVFA